MPRVSLVVITLLAATLFLNAGITAADEGWASWYGPGFHGNRMANGQIFDMNDPTTAAGNWWPFGTWLKVTNPANGKSVTVQIRDRGAFKWALDLSYAAFAALDDPKKMMIKVVYEVVPGPDAAPRDGQLQQSPTPAVSPPAKSPDEQRSGGSQPSASPAPRANESAQQSSEQASAIEAHVVQKGDTLSSIAAKYNIDISTLVALNAITDPNLLRPGQRLILRQPTRPAESSRSRDSEQAKQNDGEYTVQPGDTLEAIAARFGTDAASLASVNEINDPNLIVIGQRLKTRQGGTQANKAINTPTRPIVHVVAPGDTLSGIAARYQVGEEAIALLNGISDLNKITVGQELAIPASSATRTAPGPGTASPRQHIVKPGETLSHIALLYGVTVQQIIDANYVGDPNLIRPGDVLRIP